MFAMVVDKVVVGPSGKVVVSGIVTDGRKPSPGTRLVIHAKGRAPIEAVSGAFGHDIPEPHLIMLVYGVAAEDIPVGSRITSDPAVQAGLSGRTPDMRLYRLAELRELLGFRRE